MNTYPKRGGAYTATPSGDVLPDFSASEKAGHASDDAVRVVTLPKITRPKPRTRNRSKRG